jgi:cell wall-associated NlpC family hydrolase
MRIGQRSSFPAAFLVAVLFVSGTLVPRVVADDGVDQAKQKVDQLAQQLNDLDNRIGLLDEEHAAALDRIDALNIEIAQQESQIQGQQVVLAKLQGQLTSIAIGKFTSGGASGLAPLFSTAQAFTDNLQRGELSRVALDQGAGTSDDLDKLITDLATEQQALDAKKARQAELAVTIEQKQQQGEQLSQEMQQQLIDAKAQYGDAVALAQEKLAEKAAAAAVAKAQAAEQAAAQQAAARRAAATQPRGGGSGGNGGSSGNGGGSGSGGATDTGAGNGGGSTDAGGTSPSDTGGSSAGSGGSSVPPPSSRAGIAVAAAQSQLGVPYQFARESPGVAFDCSGLTKYAWGQAGVSLPHQSGQQFASTPHVPVDQIQPGDLIFYGSPIGHVAIYIGGGMLIHAPASGQVVKIASVNFAHIIGVARPG